MRISAKIAQARPISYAFKKAPTVRAYKLSKIKCLPALVSEKYVHVAKAGNLH